MNLSNEDRQILLNSIRDIENFPKDGILFKDITTLLNNKVVFKILMDHLVDRYKDKQIDFIVGVESRGFIFGGALAAELGVGFVPLRKPNKLPAKTIKESYTLEYSTDTIEIHADAFLNKSNAKVVLIDDLIATGGTAIAGVNLIKKLNADVIECCFVINLLDLGGAKNLSNFAPVYSVLEV